MTREPLFINANNNGYEPSQCGRTITVGELIDLLSDFDEDMPIYLKFDNGYSYGSIREDDFIEDIVEDEEF
jgi:hypothetical protein